MTSLIFTVGLIIFVTYMFFLVRMINTQHKLSEKEHGKVEYKKNKVFKIKKEKITSEKV
tara:strand:- start:909 stop:1085 length:177 start_codon:yes stop_codon:yes gene_type:complete